MSTLQEFLATHRLSPERVVRTSARIEALRPEDRLRKTARARLRQANGTDKVKSYTEAGLAKPRSGRGVTRPLLDAALLGRPVSRVVRAKLLRAVTALVSPAAVHVTASALFGAKSSPGADGVESAA